MDDDEVFWWEVPENDLQEANRRGRCIVSQRFKLRGLSSELQLVFYPKGKVPTPAGERAMCALYVGAFENVKLGGSHGLQFQTPGHFSCHFLLPEWLLGHGRFG